MWEWGGGDNHLQLFKSSCKHSSLFSSVTMDGEWLLFSWQVTVFGSFGSLFPADWLFSLLISTGYSRDWGQCEKPKRAPLVVHVRRKGEADPARIAQVLPSYPESLLTWSIVVIHWEGGTNFMDDQFSEHVITQDGGLFTLLYMNMG
ncbi:hypothetical protein HJG60_007870 [Phyllostomus discolor]|uniref:Uncharacterized protein n=1 Tax=Phyllostomus discolor TaxID=89673 RepID=A0A834BMT5_9CHIR|nr:hypothetical protein HJG60_007870 [Phyllostomus discolor]